jgi:hypothetical protein
MSYWRCSDCQTLFHTDRLSDRKCVECRSPRPDAAGRLEDHRREVIRAAVGEAEFDLVVQSLADEGFVIAPPSVVAVPVDWLARFLALTNRVREVRDLPDLAAFAALACDLPPRVIDLGALSQGVADGKISPNTARAARNEQDPPR